MKIGTFSSILFWGFPISSVEAPPVVMVAFAFIAMGFLLSLPFRTDQTFWKPPEALNVNKIKGQLLKPISNQWIKGNVLREINPYGLEVPKDVSLVQEDERRILLTFPHTSTLLENQFDFQGHVYHHFHENGNNR
jgi:hypothetical protein